MALGSAACHRAAYAAIFRKAPPCRFQSTWLSLAFGFPDRAAYSTRAQSTERTSVQSELVYNLNPAAVPILETWVQESTSAFMSLTPICVCNTTRSWGALVALQLTGGGWFVALSGLSIKPHDGVVQSTPG